MAISVLNLWLIFILTILVISLVLSLPNFDLPHQALIAVLFALIIGAVVVTLVPVELGDDASVMSYNTLLIVAYLLPIIILIILACSKIHHQGLHAKIHCDENGEECRVEKIRFTDDRNRVKVSFGR